MVWPAITIRIAARHWPNLSSVAADQIEKEVDEYLASHHEMQDVSFFKLIQAVEEKLVPKVSLQPLDVNASASVDVNPSASFDVAKDFACAVCAIM